MLRELAIRNFAIIDDLRISLDEGLTILSGETGAGKSIVIQAVQLLLGGRVSPGLIRSGADSAELEACFDIDPRSPTAGRMQADGLPHEEGLLVRRVISRQERHRTYINGRLATTAQLSALSEGLAGIAGQHAHQGLLREELHLEMLDQFGGLLPLREETAALHRRLVPLIHELERLDTCRDTQAEQRERLEFQRQEIGAAGIEPEEDARLIEERQRLRSAEQVYASLHQGSEALYGGQDALAGRLAQIRRALEKSLPLVPELESSIARLNEAGFLLEEGAADLDRMLGRWQPDPQRLEWIEKRLDLIQKLKRKYGGSLEALRLRLEELDREIAHGGRLEEELRQIRQDLERTHAALCERAESLSLQRRRVAATLAARGEAELAGLEMGGTRFAVQLETRPGGANHSPHLLSGGRLLGESGLDHARFLIAPNVGEPLKPLSAIASGGELSRVVLALKAILAEADSLSTIVFDEVDSGIGGRVAEAVGRKLAGLSRRHQILCITHLPQIAKFADHHFRIAKTVHQGRTSASITPLTEEQRVAEIARMLGGETITRKTLDHAAEMLKKDQAPAAGRGRVGPNGA